MTDKQINIVEILAEQCKNCTLYEGDTISLTISIFDRPLRGVCFDNNIYFSVDELNYIMQKLISKEQECKELKEEIKKHNDDMFKNPPEKRFYCKGCTLPYISKKLKQTLTEIKEICNKESGWVNCSNNMPTETAIFAEQILQKISECEGNDE